jgi:hypothetical protein
MATPNNQPSTGARWLEKDNPTQQADNEDLVGRVGEFVAFEAVRQQEQQVGG